MPKNKNKPQPRSAKKISSKSFPVENQAEMTDEIETQTPPVSKITQQLNLLIVLSLALFAFSIFLFWKIKKVENTLASVKGGQTQQQQQQQQQPKAQATMEQLKKLFTKDYLSFGDAKRKVLFVEFSDPSCPYCHAAAGEDPELNAQIGTQFKLDTDGGSYIPPVREMKKLVDEGQASYVMLYRNGHGNGILATQAFYCAYDQGKFWEVHNLLMNNAGYTLINDTVKNDKANIPQLVDYLSSVIDPNYLQGCLESGKYESELTRDSKVGDGFNIGGTPGFFINTTNFPGAYSFTDMKSVVDAALKS